MAKVDLDKSKKKTRAFSVWVAGMIRISEDATQEKLASYLGISQPVLNTRIKGKTTWSLKEYFATQEYFKEEFREWEDLKKQ